MVRWALLGEMTGWSLHAKGNEFIRLIPVGSDSLEKATFLESREYEYNLKIYIMRQNTPSFEKLVTTRVAQIQDLFRGDNIDITLSDNTQFINVTLESLELDVDPEDTLEQYFVAEWDLTGTHYA